MKPKTYFFIPEKGSSEGIRIAYTKSRKSISIGGWFDRIVGIGNTEISLIDFIKNVGIPKKDLEYVIDHL